MTSGLIMEIAVALVVLGIIFFGRHLWGSPGNRNTDTNTTGSDFTHAAGFWSGDSAASSSGGSDDSCSVSTDSGGSCDSGGGGGGDGGGGGGGD
jgi:hypothetical protein